MDIKDINIRNLQSEIIRLRNHLADRDAYVRSMEQDKEEWTREARVGYISLEEHFSEIESCVKKTVMRTLGSKKNWMIPKAGFL